MPYAICKACNVTVNVGDIDTPPNCVRCHEPTTWLVAPISQGASIDDIQTAASGTDGGVAGSHKARDDLEIGKISQNDIIAAPPFEDGPISRPTVPMDSGDNPAELVGRQTGGGGAIFPRQTPNRMSIPSLTPPKKEPELPLTRPTDTPRLKGPTPTMVLILVVVAALTGIVLALLSP